MLDEETKSKGNKNSSEISESDKVSFKATGSGCFNCGDKRHYAAHWPRRRMSGSPVTRQPQIIFKEVDSLETVGYFETIEVIIVTR